MQDRVGRHHAAPRMSAEEVGWRQKVKASMAEVLRMATADDGWTFVTDKKGVRGLCPAPAARLAHGGSVRA